jgi:hypothetical protein
MEADVQTTVEGMEVRQKPNVEPIISWYYSFKTIEVSRLMSGNFI